MYFYSISRSFPTVGRVRDVPAIRQQQRTDRAQVAPAMRVRHDTRTTRATHVRHASRHTMIRANVVPRGGCFMLIDSQDILYFWTYL